MQKKDDYGPLPSANPNTKRHASIPNVDGTTNFTTSICKYCRNILIFVIPTLKGMTTFVSHTNISKPAKKFRDMKNVYSDTFVMRR